MATVVPVELEMGASRMLRGSDRAAEPEDQLRALLAEGSPDLCAVCGRSRTLLLSWCWWGNDSRESVLVRACVWCDAGTDRYLEAVWDGENWLLRSARPAPTGGDPALALAVRQHLEAIATERPQLPAPRPDGVERLWSDGSGSRDGHDGPVALVRLLNPWLDLAAARRFLTHVADGDPRRPAPPVVGELREVCSAARDAQDEMALLRAEDAAMGSLWRTRWEHEAELGVHLEIALRVPDQQTQLRWREVRRVLSDYDDPSELSDPFDLWSAQHWAGTLARARRARVELAALAYPPKVRRALLEWIDGSSGSPLEPRAWRRTSDDPPAGGARTPADVHTRAEHLLSQSL